MTTRGADGERRRVARRRMRLDPEDLCAARFVPDPDVALPAEVVVYDVQPDGPMTWGEPVTVPAAEGRAWVEARHTYLEALSRALEQLYWAHGGRDVDVDVLLLGHRRSKGLRAPLHLPGWRRRAAERSTTAQRAFLDRLTAADEVYRPVRERIEAARAEDERRVEELRLEELRQGQELAERRRRLMEVADRPVWAFVTVGEVHLVRRVDVPPTEPVPDDDTAADREPLSAVQLEAALVGPRVHRNQRWLVWDRAACEAVERECAARGAPVWFGPWWDSITTGPWWRTAWEESAWVTRAAPRPDDRPDRPDSRQGHFHSYSGTIHVSGMF